MKRVVNVILLIIATLTLVGVSSFVRAQQENDQASANAQKTSDYALPYPGVLPDNPLYNLKMLRDKIVSLLISDPLKKADFYLLMADKRINTGLFLVNKGKYELAESTISKGQNYLDLAVSSVSELKKSGTDVKNLTQKINNALSKHEEVLGQILKKVPEEIKPGIRNAIERNKQEQKRVKKL